MVRKPGPHRLVLASASARRKELLAQIDIVPAEPGALARRLSCLKAEAVTLNDADAWILAADTVVGVGTRILGKPEDVFQARKFLEFLSGCRHKVYSGITVIAPETAPVTRLVTTTVIFKRLEEREINHYIESGEWRGKAGGYAIQGAAGAFVRTMNGSYFNVVGLPLYETLSLLRGTGYVPPR